MSSLRYITSITGWLVWFDGFQRHFQLYRGGQFYWWRKPEYPEKTTDLWQVTNTHGVHLALIEIRTHNVTGDRP